MLYVLVHGAVEVFIRSEPVKGGYVLPSLARWGHHVIWGLLLEEALHVSVRKFFGVLDRVGLQQVALLLPVHLPKFEVVEADGRMTSSKTHQRQVAQNDGGDEHSADNLKGMSTFKRQGRILD